MHTEIGTAIEMSLPNMWIYGSLVLTASWPLV